jgi:hypothetical protein
VWTLPDDSIQPALTAGVYDVAVSAVDPAGNLGGDTTANELAVIDAYEPNDDRATAYDLADHAQQWLSTVAGPGSQGDDDWYAIHLVPNASQPIAVLQGSDVGRSLELTVMDGQGQPWDPPRFDRSDDYLFLELPLSGDWHLKVGGDNSGRAYDLWWGTPHPGDANLDGKTNVRDFNQWNTHKFTTGTSWPSGDFDRNGRTDVRDFLIWNLHKFTSAPAPAPVDAALDTALLPDHSGTALDPAELAWLDTTNAASAARRSSDQRTRSEAAVDKLLASYWQ